MKHIILAIILCSSASTAEWAQKYITVKATAYCQCEKCCPGFSDGKTATMRDASLPGVAVDKKLIPLGSRLDIPGYGNWQLADDVGGGIRENHIDVRFKTHQEAVNWGVKLLKIRVWEKKE